MRGKTNVDRKHPQFFQHLQNARFRRNRQREDHEIDARAPAELDEVVDGAQLALAGAIGAAAIIAAIVEQADDVDAGVLLPPQFLDHARAGIAAADNDRAAVEPAFACPFAHEQEHKPARQR